MHVVFIDLHTEDLRVALDVVPLGVGLQRLLDGGILEPRGQFGRVDQVVDDALRGEGEEGRGEEGRIVGCEGAPSDKSEILNTRKAKEKEMCTCTWLCVIAADHIWSHYWQVAICNYD